MILYFCGLGIGELGNCSANDITPSSTNVLCNIIVVGMLVTVHHKSVKHYPLGECRSWEGLWSHWRFDNLNGSHHQNEVITSAQVVETSVIVITYSPSQVYTHPDDYTSPTCSMTWLLGSNYFNTSVILVTWSWLSKLTHMSNALIIHFMRMGLC